MSRSTMFLFAGLAVVFAVLFAFNGQSTDLSLALGRLHPSIVHLPIGVLLLAMLLDWFARRPRYMGYAPVVPLLFQVGAWCALVAAVLGLLLADGRGYDAATLGWHKWFGIGVATLAVAACALRARAALDLGAARWYRWTTAFLFAGVVIGGHLGGTLTHGTGYLTRHLPDGVRTFAGLAPKDSMGRRAVENPDTTSVYAALIQPILNDRCASSCHSAGRAKGGLALDTWDGLKKGGKDGKVVVPGHADESEIMRRVGLPPGHKDKMPPDDGISVAEVELIRWWIDGGAKPDVKLSEMEQSPVVRDVLDAYGLGDLPTGIFTVKVARPDTSTVEAIRRAGLLVQPLGRNTPYVEISATNVRQDFRADVLELLRPIAPQVASVDLSGTPVGDSVMTVLGALPHLTHLHLENTRVTDAGLTQLRGLRYLEYLNLYGTRVTDAGLRALDSLPRLRSLYLWETGVTASGAAALRRSLPRLAVSLGGVGGDTSSVPPQPKPRGR